MSALLWNKFLWVCFLGCLPEDTNEDRIKKQTLVMVAALFCLAGIVWGCLYMSLGLYAGIIPFGYSVFSIISITTFIITKQYRFFRFSQLLMILLLPYLMQWSLGGFIEGSMVLLWALVCPIGALIFHPGRPAMRWFGAYLLLALISYAVEPLLPATSHVSPAMGMLFFLINIIAVSSLVFFFLYYFVSEAENLRHGLEETIKKLHETRAQLVQSEKMAGLGQLIAGVSHEINTPAGAIVSAIEEIDKDYVSLLEELIFILNSLSGELKENYLSVCTIALTIPSEYGTSEVRKISREMEMVLQENSIANARLFSKSLASVGFNVDHLDHLMPLLQSTHAETIQHSLYTLGMTRIHTRDIRIAIQKIVNLVKALKLYSRSDQDEISLTTLSDDIITTLTILHNRLKHGITVINDFDKLLPKVECLAEQLNQVWTNLINNAVEAMGGKGQIIIRLKMADQDQVAIEFEDNGPGIPDHVLPHIFDAYYTTKPKGEGTGLGLYISKEIIDKHQGTIEVQSSPSGTLFRITLPVKANIKIIKEEYV